VFVVPALGGYPSVITSTPRGVQQFAWSPDSRTIAFAAQDEPEKPAGFERHNQSFEVLPTTHMITTAAIPPTHLWVVPASGGTPRRLTSGSWSLPVARPPGAPASAIVWTKDGTAVAFTRTGDVGGRGGTSPAAPSGQRGVESGRGATPGPGRGAPGGQGQGRGGGSPVFTVSVADGSIAPFGNVTGTHPQFSPVDDSAPARGRQLRSVVAGRPAARPHRRSIAARERSGCRTVAARRWHSERVDGLATDGPARKIDLGDSALIVASTQISAERRHRLHSELPGLS
jgi:hypothetical protein